MVPGIIKRQASLSDKPISLNAPKTTSTIQVVNVTIVRRRNAETAWSCHVFRFMSAAQECFTKGLDWWIKIGLHITSLIPHAGETHGLL